MSELGKMLDTAGRPASVAEERSPSEAEQTAAPAFSATYPNIVPANNLRLPDALTIKYGPAPLLARFILEGDKAVRNLGLRLRLRSDFDELIYVNQQHVVIGDWLPVPEAFNPEFAELTPENSFWVSGEDDQGEIVVTWAARIYNWIGTNLAEQVRVAWYGRDLGQPCVVTAEAAALISGIVSCAGASWVRPDFRGKHLSHLMPRIGKAYACSRWPINWAIGFIGLRNLDKGLAASYGQKNLSYSILYPGSAWGEVALAYTTVADVYEDLANFLAKRLHGAEDDTLYAMLSSTSLAQEVTNTSSDGVFHGNNSRS
jgi:hypothetical protein